MNGFWPEPPPWEPTVWTKPRYVSPGRALRFWVLPGTCPHEAAIRLAETLTQAGLPTKADPVVSAVIWKKVVINAAINPLTALLGVPNGELAVRETTRRMMRQIVDEAQTVAEAEGIPMDAATLFESVLTVCRGTAANRSSMLMDVLSERRTEIDAISGAIVERGRIQGHPNPDQRTVLESDFCKARNLLLGQGYKGRALVFRVLRKLDKNLRLD